MSAQDRPEQAPAGALHVDWTRCRARGHCIELLPEVLAADPWGYPAARGDVTGRGDALVPARLKDAAGRAVTGCPRLALRFALPAPGQPR